MSSQGRYRQRLSKLAANWRVLALRGSPPSYLVSWSSG